MKVKNKTQLNGKHIGKPSVVFQDSQSRPGKVQVSPCSVLLGNYWGQNKIMATSDAVSSNNPTIDKPLQYDTCPDVFSILKW